MPESVFQWPQEPKWRVQVGTHQDVRDLVSETLRDEDWCMMTDLDRALTRSHLKLEEAARAIDLVEIDLHAAGFIRDPGMDILQIYREVLALGHYGLCPQETAAQFRRQRLEQEAHTSLFVASEPFPCGPGRIEPYKSAPSICALNTSTVLREGNFARWLGFETTLGTLIRSKAFRTEYPNLPRVSMIFALRQATPE